MSTIQSIKYRLKPDTIKHITQKTKLTEKELIYTPIADIDKLLIKRGAKKKPNPIKNFIKELYQKFGEKFGLLERQINIYTDLD